MPFRLSPLVLSLGIVILAVLPVHAVEPDEVLQDPALEARAREISEGLRCLVCQNQSIDDSEAPLAKDLRLLVRERLKAGDSDEQIVDFIVARYGEFVLLKPRFERHTALLWLAPIGLLCVGAITLGVALRRRRRDTEVRPGSVAPLSPSEQERVAELTGPGAP
jgi:cytochrome c-type biogenesis protein CcmH